MLIPTVIDSHLRVDGNFLGADLVEQILDELTVRNVARDEARKRDRYGWQDIPEEFILGYLDGDELVMPRGYAMEYKLLLREHGHCVKWRDRRTWHRRAPIYGKDEFSYREHQIPAVAHIKRHQQGMYEAPTGSGKTVTCCGFLWEKHPLKSLIIVDKIELLEQWRKRIKEHVAPSFEIGKIGNGKWIDDSPITVATIQTIWSAIKRGILPEDFFERFDCVIVDECHHVTADTFQQIISNFTAKYRFGVSATPDRKDDKFEIALNILGDVFYADSEEELRDAGILAVPRVYRIATKFEFEYWGDHESDDDGLCDMPGCKKEYYHKHRNNYAQLKSALVSDKLRNALVASMIHTEIESGPHHHLIVSDEIRQLDALETTLRRQAKHFGLWLPPIYVMTGKVSGKKREAMIAEIEQSDEAIIFATVAKEGLDIKKIDRIYLPFPARSGTKVEQWIGRGTRNFEGKGETLVFDFADLLVKLLAKQFKNRRVQCYDKLGLEVIL